jgi:hypothetical protein
MPSSTIWPDSSLLGTAREWLRGRLREGDRCPLCDQRAQLYRRAINARMVAALVALYRAGAHDDWVHLPTLVPNSGDPAKLRYWGLIAEELITRPDGGRAGYYRVTDRGVAFLRGQLTVDRWALVYDGRCLGMEGEQVSIRDCSPKGFDLDDLLQGAA